MYFDDMSFVMGNRNSNKCPNVFSDETHDFFTLQFDRKGSIFYKQDETSKEIKLQAPVLYLTYPGCKYRFGAESRQQWDHSFIALRGERTQQIFKEGFIRLMPKGIIQLKSWNEFAEVFDRTQKYFSSRKTSLHYEAVLGIEKLLGLVIKMNLNQRKSSGYDHVMNNLITKIETNPLKNWNFEQCAKSMRLSYSHFRRLFRQTTGKAPHHYVLLFRMKVVADKIQNKELSIKQAAQHCGYDDPAQFSKMFKRQMGLPPRQYLQLQDWT